MATNTTFKSKVKQFWNWYASVAPRFYETIEAGRCLDLQGEVTAKSTELYPDFAWVFGPGPADRGGHSFTLSGEGILNRQFLTEFWKSQAPEIDGWTFHASRQPGELEPDAAFEINSRRFVFGETFFSANVDEENELVDVILYNDAFGHVDDKLRSTVLFLILDELLGEYGTEQWIGGIEAGHQKPAGATSIFQLRDLLHDLEISRAWQKLPPTERMSLYEIGELVAEFPRADIRIGTTANFELVSQHLDQNGEMENPIAGSGADFVYVEFSSSILPVGEETMFRANIADAIAEKLIDESVGQHIGGAFGMVNSYIDFLLFDTPRGLEIISQLLATRNMPSGTGIHFFANDRRSESVLI